MKKRKRIGSIMLAIILTLMMGCSQTSEETKNSVSETDTVKAKVDNNDKTTKDKADKIMIGYASCDESNPFVVACNVGLHAQAEESGIEIIVGDAKNDTSTQLTQVENMISQGAQAIILTITDTNSAEPFYELCSNAGIPLIGMNRSIVDYCDGFVGTDSSSAAEKMATYIAEKLGGKGKVVHLQGVLGEDAENDRTEAILKVLEANPDIERIRVEAADWDRVKAMEKVETWIQAGDQFDAVIANSDEMAVGAMLALEAANRLDGVIIGGIDGSQVVCEYVKEGKITLTMAQDTYAMGAESVKMAIRYITGESTEFEYFDIPYEPVTVENVDKYLE